MSTLQRLQCDSCGGRIDRASLTCTSCGMQYEREQNEPTLLRIVTEQRRTEVLSGEVLITDEALINEPEKAIEYAVTQMASQMAKRLIPFLELEWNRDWPTRQTGIYGRLRVARPANGGTINGIRITD